MKTTYLNNRQQSFWRRSRRWLLIILAVVIVAPALSWFRGSAVVIARPWWWLGDRLSATTATVKAIFRGQASLIEENKLLKTNLAQLQQRTIDYDLLVEEKRYLESVLGRAGSEPLLVVARVLAGPHQTPEEILIIDRGLKNTTTQFHVGDLVTAEGTIALGKIESVGARTSQVKLFSAPGTEVSVRIGLEQLPAVAQGRGGGNFIVTLPRGLLVNVGALVTMSTPERDLVIGEVSAVDRDPEGTLQNLLIRFPVNLIELKHVEINLNEW